METEAAPAPGRRHVTVRRALIGAVVGCAVLGGVLMVLPPGRQGPPPAPGPVARAATAVGTGTPASLPDLAALIGDREAHLRAHPGDVESWAVLGAAYVERGERTARPRYYPRAEKALRTSLRARPRGNAQALGGLARLAVARNDFRAARSWGEDAVAAAPRRWTVYPALIDAYRGLGDHKAARRARDRLVSLRSGSPVSARVGLVHRDDGRREDAAAALADSVARASTPSERAVRLLAVGELAWERGEPAESLRAYEAALRADSDEHAALAGQGRALAALGRVSEALRSYQSALAKRPLPQYALELGELYESLGMGGAARAQYDVLRERVRAEAAEGVNDELLLGRFEADHGDAATAVRRLRAEWRRHPSVAVADALGWALHRSGAHEEALGFAARATDKEHGGGVRSALYAYHRGAVERALGRTGAARRHLGEALRINPHFSPLLVPSARRALKELGEPEDGGLEEVGATDAEPEAEADDAQDAEASEASEASEDTEGAEEAGEADAEEAGSGAAGAGAAREDAPGSGGPAGTGATRPAGSSGGGADGASRGRAEARPRTGADADTDAGPVPEARPGGGSGGGAREGAGAGAEEAAPGRGAGAAPSPSGAERRPG
ncbi:hypothetical protein GCM10010515_75040 [Streptomyces fructofermentans]|uniref:Tetratricopeptide repeat protein n=1 Tax=Streptomyces fructofermentans TaxID=152141 RepID=A0A918NUZ2_9ACTN|nr:hypothetical protein GCM10010515_75040 [Streptomyces fructofermentans]